MSTNEPEAVVEATARDLGIGADDVRQLLHFLAPLAAHNVETYRHSIRVGVLAARLAQAHGEPGFLALFGGAWHDIGKLDVPNTVLRAERFGDEERHSVERHAWCGFLRIAGVYYEAGLVAGLHHAFQSRPYGLTPGRYPSQVVQAAQMVAVCDFYDALVTRKDGRYSEDERSRPMEIMAQYYPAHTRWISWLAAEGPGCLG